MEQSPRPEKATERDPKKEKILAEVLKIIDELQNEHDYGGSEDAGGTLQPGYPKFDDAKVKIEEIIFGN